jgi:hypothetical protein
MGLQARDGKLISKESDFSREWDELGLAYWNVKYIPVF